ncbi:MAG: class I SAM-dependent methyltransferase [Planctomycetota bacterium]
MNARDPGPMYEALARWQLRRQRRAPPGTGRELRKRLRPVAAGGDGPTDGAAGLDRWLIAHAGGRAHGRVLDLGCGFGESLLRWLEAGASSGVGVAASATQIAAATAEAQRRGLAARVVFCVGDFLEPVPGPFDVVVAIEALAHANDLDAVLRHVHRALAPGGRLLWLDDVLDDAHDGSAAEPANTDDVAELAACWASPPLRSLGTVRAALTSTGFAVVDELDLTARVPFAPPTTLRRRRGVLRLLRAIAPLPWLRHVANAFLGGLALERLYARGCARYHLWIAERREVPR